MNAPVRCIPPARLHLPSLAAAALCAAAISQAAAQPSRGWRTLDEVAFVPTVVAQSRAVTSVDVSPDGAWLYATTLVGEILRWPIDPADGGLGDVQRFASAHFQDESGPRGLIGLAFDPTDPAMLWVTDNYPVALWGAQESRPEFSGRVSRVRIAEGPAFDGEVETYVRGLPRSCVDHLSNSLRFRANPEADPPFLLYLSQGSNTAIGSADRAWCFRPERLLSAAILEIDPSLDPPEGGFDVATEPVPEDGGNRRFGFATRIGPILWAMNERDLKSRGIVIDSGPYRGNFVHFAENGVASVRTGSQVSSPLVTTFYDPFAADAPVRLFATGVRNAYDLVWHSNGWLYVAVNGPNGGGVTPDDPRTRINEGVQRAGGVEDYLLWLRRGDYGGHPNPLRNEYVVHGGNPTAGSDPNEISFYPVGVEPDPRYRPEQAYALGHHWSPNGLIEYRSDDTDLASERGGALGGALDGALDGALIVANYAKGGTLRVFTLDADGGVAADTVLVDPDGLEIAFKNPLDLTAAARGRLYVSTLDRSNGRSQIVRLDPAQRRTLRTDSGPAAAVSAD